MTSKAYENDTKDVWGGASREFADSASGDKNCFVRKDGDEKSHFYKTELPILQAKSKENEIIVHEVSGFAKVHSVEMASPSKLPDDFGSKYGRHLSSEKPQEKAAAPSVSTHPVIAKYGRTPDPSADKPKDKGLEKDDR